jgi:uncharacterized membrane protein
LGIDTLEVNANLHAYLAAMGGTYSFVKTASANLREQEDTWNTAIGGFVSGAILGLRGEFTKHRLLHQLQNGN